MKWTDFVFISYLCLSPVMFLICRIFPINENKIVFMQMQGCGYGCSPKYIAEELLDRNLDYDMVWEVLDVNANNNLPDKIRPVKYYSLRGIYEFATAKAWVINSSMTMLIFKRKKQVCLQTWHGFGPKKGRPETTGVIISTLRKIYVKLAAKKVDIYLSRSKLQEELEFVGDPVHLYNGPFLEVGTPRIDILVNRSEDVRDTGCQKLNISPDKKILLYAPTFRKLFDRFDSDVDWNRCVSALTKKFGGDWVVLIRMHPLVADKNLDANLSGVELLNASYYPDMQELLLVSDVLITDYSSCSFDFALTERLCILYALDMDEYLESDKDFFMDLNTLPFLLTRSNDELISAIEKYDERIYVDAITSFNQKYNTWESGTASSKTSDWLLGNMH